MKVQQTFDEEKSQESLCWTSPTKLKCGTEIAVVCQKGQKSDFDPTPNQESRGK